MNLSARVPTSLSVAVTVRGAGATGAAASFGFLFKWVVTAPFDLLADNDRLPADFLTPAFFAPALFTTVFFARFFLTFLLAVWDFAVVFFLLSVLVFTDSSLLSRHMDERRGLGDLVVGGLMPEALPGLASRLMVELLLNQAGHVRAWLCRQARSQRLACARHAQAAYSANRVAPHHDVVVRQRFCQRR